MELSFKVIFRPCFTRVRIQKLSLRKLRHTHSLYLLHHTLINYLEQSRSWEAKGPRLVKKFLSFYGTPKFIKVFTTARYLSLFRATTIHSMLPHSAAWRSILILSSLLGLCLPSSSFHQIYPPNSPMHTPVSHTCHMPEAYPGILFEGGVQQIQLRKKDRENGDLGAVAP